MTRWEHGVWFVTNKRLLGELKEIKGLLLRLIRPERPMVTCIDERKDGMVKYMQYEVTVNPVPSGIDAVDQSLMVHVGVAEVLSVNLGSSGGKEIFEAPVDSAVKVELSYSDAAGNASETPVVVEFTAVDVIGPPTPAVDALAIECTGERLEEDPVE